MRNNSSSEGIFVLNNQVFSVIDLINALRRQGIRIRLTRNGLSIAGNEITSITDLDNNRCPLAPTCERRVALMDFLKLRELRSRVSFQQNNPIENYPHQQQNLRQDSQSASYPFSTYPNQEDTYPAQEEKRQSGGFIEPNNHDLFEGNVDDSPSSFYDNPFRDENEEDEFSGALFDDDEDDYSASTEQSNFDGPLFPDNDDYEDTQEPLFGDSPRFTNPSNSSPQKTNCPHCGYQLDSSWVVCPKCGERITHQERPKSERLFI
jgi:hypothetical protein